MKNFVLFPIYDLHNVFLSKIYHSKNRCHPKIVGKSCTDNEKTKRWKKSYGNEWGGSIKSCTVIHRYDTLVKK